MESLPFFTFYLIMLPIDKFFVLVSFGLGVGSFAAIRELEKRINNYIASFNNCLQCRDNSINDLKELNQKLEKRIEFLEQELMRR